MKIYSKGNFISGTFMVLLGLLNLGAGVVKNNLNLSHGVLILVLFFLGGHYLYRSLNKKMAVMDDLESTNEINQLMLLKNRSAAFQIHRYICLGLTAAFFVMSAFEKTEMFKYIAVGFAFSFALSLLVDIVTFIFYSKTKD